MQEYIGYLITALVFLFTTFIQVSKIKINPWSAIFGYLGKLINKGLYDKLDEIQSELKNTTSSNITLQIQQKRYEIIKFSMECRADIKHFKCEFDRIVEVHGEYMELLKMINGENGQIDEEYKYIQEIYRDRLRLNDFVYKKGDK